LINFFSAEHPNSRSHYEFHCFPGDILNNRFYPHYAGYIPDLIEKPKTDQSDDQKNPTRQSDDLNSSIFEQSNIFEETIFENSQNSVPIDILDEKSQRRRFLGRLFFSKLLICSNALQFQNS